jgi:hypothetical protein
MARHSTASVRNARLRNTVTAVQLPLSVFLLTVLGITLKAVRNFRSIDTGTMHNAPSSAAPTGSLSIMTIVHRARSPSGSSHTCARADMSDPHVLADAHTAIPAAAGRRLPWHR